MTEADSHESGWDAYAWRRLGDLLEGVDGSYEDLMWQVVDVIDLSPDSEVLDVGCGVGIFTDRLNKEGYSGTGIDKSQTCVEAGGSLGLDISTDSISEILEKRQGRLFDGAVLNMVLHAVENVPAMYREVASAVRTGGLLVATVPTELWFSNHKDTLVLESEGELNDAPFAKVSREFTAAGRGYGNRVTYYGRSTGNYASWAYPMFDLDGVRFVATPLDRSAFPADEPERVSPPGQENDPFSTAPDIVLFRFRRTEVPVSALQ